MRNDILIGGVTGGLGGTIIRILGGSKLIRDFQPGDIVLALPEDNHDAVPILVENVRGINGAATANLETFSQNHIG